MAVSRVESLKLHIQSLLLQKKQMRSARVVSLLEFKELNLKLDDAHQALYIERKRKGSTIE